MRSKQLKPKKVDMIPKISRKSLLSMIFSVLLFTACAVFVAIRGYECFDKYLKKPEATDIKFKVKGELPFPAITLCPLKSTFEDILQECNLDLGDYLKSGPWLGSGIPNCSDPKLFFDKLFKIEQLGIEKMTIRTNNDIKFSFNKTELYSLEWSFSPYRRVKCFTLTISDEIVSFDCFYLKKGFASFTSNPLFVIFYR